MFSLSLMANPHSEVKESAPAPEKSDEKVLRLDESMVISPAPEAPTKISRTESARYYPYQQALTFHAGYDSDFPKISVEDLILGFEYLFPKFLSPKLEAGADLHEDGKGHIHAGARWIHNERGYFRPSFKLALDHQVEGKKGLATLADPEHYFVRLAGTLEFVISNPYSLRFEPSFLFNHEKTRTSLTLGLSRGW